MSASVHPAKRKAGFVALIGRPNVGKSTLLNCLIGEKLAGISPKPQTTRGVINGILTRPQGQVVFLDTPGIHYPKDWLGDWMAREVEKAMEGADLLYWLVLPGKIQEADQRILQIIKNRNAEVILVVNQIDRYPKPEILPVLDYYQQEYHFLEMIPVSAKTGLQVDLLTEKTFEHLPEGRPLFPEDQISDQNERFLAGEIIREKLFHLTRQEIPYATAVVIDEFKEREDGLVEIYAMVVAEKESQKAVLVGKGGAKMKEIGKRARLELERFLGKKVFLKLWVKTVHHWKKNPAALRRLGYGL